MKTNFLLTLVLSTISLLPAQDFPFLDANFGENGIQRFDAGAEFEYLSHTALQNDGKIVVAGQTEGEFFVARYLSDGNKDLSFGADNTGVFRHDAMYIVDDLLVQSDGRIIVSGTDWGDHVVVQLDANGNFDPTFGVDGILNVEESFTPERTLLTSTVDDKMLLALIARPDSLTLMRFLPDGNLDLSFGNGGVRKTWVGFDFQAPRIQNIKTDSQGRIIFAGGELGVDRENMLMFRFLANGDLDTSFGLNGFSSWNPTGQTFSFDKIQDFIITPQDECIIIGHIDLDSDEARLAIGKVGVSGLLDPAFGTNGFINTPAIQGTGTLNGLVELPDGNYLAVGRQLEKMALVKFSIGGILQTNYGNEGVLIQDFGIQSYDELQKVVYQASQNQLFAFGNSFANLDISTFHLGQNDSDLALIKLQVDGNIDTGFGTAGKAKRFIVPTNDQPYASALTSNQKLVLLSKAGNGANTALLRFNNNGQLDHSFGNFGKVLLHEFQLREQQQAIDQQIDGKILVGGTVTNNMAVFRFHSNGQLDAGFANGGRQVISNSFTTKLVRAQADGKIMLIGESASFGNVQMIAVRLLNNGDLDSSFGDNGRITFDIGANTTSRAAALFFDNNEYLLFASINEFPIIQNPTFIRFDQQGNLVSSFGDNGILRHEDIDILRFNEAFQWSNGKILAFDRFPNQETLAAQFNADGSFDAPFGFNGILTNDMQGIGDDKSSTTLLETNNQKILMAGEAGWSESLFFTHLLQDGTVNTDFGNAGFIELELDEDLVEEIRSMHRLPNGDVWVTGEIAPAPGAGQDANIFMFRLELDEVLTSVEPLSYYAEESSIYPNPAEDYFCWHPATATNRIERIEILDVSGRIVQLVSQVALSESCVQLKGLAKGIYFLNIYREEGRKVEKLIIR